MIRHPPRSPLFPYTPLSRSSVPAQPPASDVLVIDRDDLPGARGWSESLARLGVRTRYVALPGFVEMIMTAPHAAVTPQSMIDRKSTRLNSSHLVISYAVFCL